MPSSLRLQARVDGGQNGREVILEVYRLTYDFQCIDRAVIRALGFGESMTFRIPLLAVLPSCFILLLRILLHTASWSDR